MKLKKAAAWSLAIVLSLASSLTVTAAEEKHEEVFYDVVTGEGVSREELEQYLSEYQPIQYEGTTTGNATLILPGDYLLDGDYENGELVNGGIYYSIEDAFWGVQQDKMDALELNAEASVYPSTGVIKGIDSDGNFWYTVHSSGKTKSTTVTSSETWVATESDIWRDIGDGSTLTSDDYSFVVSLIDSSGKTVGSYRGYANGVRGGNSFSTTAYQKYSVKIVAEKFPLNWYCHGDGSVSEY